MIYEERIYTIAPGKVAQYLETYRELGLPVQLEVMGKLIGYWHTEIGGLNKVVHIWAFDSLDDRQRRRASLAQHPRWPAYLAANLPLIEAQENRILIPASFSPLK